MTDTLAVTQVLPHYEAMVRKLAGPSQSKRELPRNGRSAAIEEVDDRITIPFGASASTTASTSTPTSTTLRSGIDKYRTLSGRAAAASTSTLAVSSTPLATFKKDMVAAVRTQQPQQPHHPHHPQPRDPPAVRAQRLMDQKQFAAALPLFTEAIQQAGGSAQTKLTLFFQRGSCALAARRFKQAVDDLTHVIDLTPINAMVLAKRAKALAALLEFPGALRDYNDAIAMTAPTHPQLRALLLARAAVYANMGNVALALEDLAHAQTTTQGGERDPELFYQRARLRVQCGQLSHAVDDLGKFIELQQDQDDWRHGDGKHEGGKEAETRGGGAQDKEDGEQDDGEEEDHVRDHERLIEVRVERASLMRKLAVAAEEQHRRDEETIAAEEGEQQPLLGHQHSTGNYHTSSTSPPSSSSSGKRRRHGSAQRQSQSSTSNPYELLEESSFGARSRESKKMNEFAAYDGATAMALVEKAIDEYTAVLAADEAHVEARRLRGECLALLGRQGDALRDFDGALATDPHDFTVQMAKAKLLFASQRVPDAITELTNVLDVNGFFVDALFLRAEMLVDQGELHRACADYTAIVDGHLESASNPTTTTVTTIEKRGGGGGGGGGGASAGKVTNEYAVHALLMRARVHQQLHEYEAAAADYQRILESRPNDMDAQIELQENDVKKAAHERQREQEAMTWLIEKDREEKNGGGATAGTGGGSTTSASATGGGTKSKKKKKKKKKSKASGAAVASAAATSTVDDGDETRAVVEDDDEEERRGDAVEEIFTRISQSPAEEAALRPTTLTKKASSVSIVVTRDEACESMWDDNVEEASRPLRFKRGTNPEGLFTSRIDTGSVEEPVIVEDPPVVWVPQPTLNTDDDEEEPDVEEPTPLEVLVPSTDASSPVSEAVASSSSPPPSVSPSAATTPSHVTIRERLVDEKYLKKRQKQLDKLRSQLVEACAARDRSTLEEIMVRAERKGMVESLEVELELAQRVIHELEEELRRAEEERAKQERYRQQELERDRRRREEEQLAEEAARRREKSHAKQNGSSASEVTTQNGEEHPPSSSKPSIPSLVIRPIAYGQALHLAEQHQQQILQFQRLVQEKDAEIAFLRAQLSSSASAHPATLTENDGLLYGRGDVLQRTPVSKAFDAASRRADALIQWMGPSAEAEDVRVRILNFVKRVVEHHWASSMGGPPLLFVSTGSFPMKTYLPTADLDVCLIVPKELEPTWHFAVLNALCLAGSGSGEDALPIMNGSSDGKSSGATSATSSSASSVGPSGSSAALPSTHTVRNVSFINAEVRVVKCTVDNVAVDFTANRVGGLGALLLLDAMDQRVSENHLLKRSIVLIKSWCIYESGAYTSGGLVGGGGGVLGASQGALSTYAINTIVMSIFNEWGAARIASPLHALLLFLDKMATFPWHESALTLFGPVPLGLVATSSSLSDALQRLHSKSVRPPMAVMALEDVERIRGHIHDHFGVLDPSFTLSSAKTSTASSTPSAVSTPSVAATTPPPASGATTPSSTPSPTVSGSAPPFSSSAATPTAKVLPKMFPIRACNVLDPLDDRNNLARSVSHDSFPAMKRAFTLGRIRLVRLLQDAPPADDSLDSFFANCWREYGRGDGWRPDLLVHPRQIWHARSGGPSSVASSVEDEARWQTMLPDYLLLPPIFAPQHPLFAHHAPPHHHHHHHHQHHHHQSTHPLHHAAFHHAAYPYHHHSRQAYGPYFVGPPYTVNGSGGGGPPGGAERSDRGDRGAPSSASVNGHVYSPGHGGGAAHSRTANSSPSAYKSSPRRAQSLPGPSSSASLAAAAAVDASNSRPVKPGGGSGGGGGGGHRRNNYDSPTPHHKSKPSPQPTSK